MFNEGLSGLNGLSELFSTETLLLTYPCEVDSTEPIVDVHQEEYHARLEVAMDVLIQPCHMSVLVENMPTHVDHDLLPYVDDADEWPGRLLNGLIVNLMVLDAIVVVGDSFFGVPSSVLKAT